MYTEVALGVIKAVATYAADQYAQREQAERFERMERRILEAINAAKVEILSTIREVNDERLLDAATAIIEVFRSYDRGREEYKRLQDITSIDGISAQTELARRIRDFAPVDIEYHKFFVAWLLVSCARAFAHIELTKLRKASDFDSALEQFVLIRDGTQGALAGVETINARRFSGGVFETAEVGAGEGLVATVGYYFDRQFVDVASYTRVPFDRNGRDRARAKAQERRKNHIKELWESSEERKTLQHALDEACRHVNCGEPRFPAFAPAEGLA
ncbi:hypothetical protein [Mesorhizobium sp. M0088]|uniref:hypothetical protein n=1 Tax=Mesorhizobium sp. M0088 TaxID=2956873 RepID=UPI0033350EE6